MSRSSIRWALLGALLLGAAAGCGSDKPHARPDAGALDDDDAGKSDAGQSDAGSTQSDSGASSDESRLERPGALPRPPKSGLPPELLPPR